MGLTLGRAGAHAVPVTGPAPTAAQRGRKILAQLLDWWASSDVRAERDLLPWRAEAVDPWGILVSEVMLAQTQVARVAQRYPGFVQRFGSPAALAAAPLAEVLRAWQGLGYPRRAVRLHQCAGVLVSSHAGEVPRELAGLLALPGVGPYTARAVLAFAFDEPMMPVDTNIGRVLARATGRRLATAEAQAIGDSMAGGRRAALALMDLGATVCRSRAPRCDKCPLSADCEWNLQAGPDPAVGSAACPGPQPRYAGSDREGRGRLLRAAGFGPVTEAALSAAAGWPDDAGRAAQVAATLVADGLLSIHRDGRYVLG